MTFVLPQVIFLLHSFQNLLFGSCSLPTGASCPQEFWLHPSWGRTSGVSKHQIPAILGTKPPSSSQNASLHPRTFISDTSSQTFPFPPPFVIPPCSQLPPCRLSSSWETTGVTFTSQLALDLSMAHYMLFSILLPSPLPLTLSFCNLVLQKPLIRL